MPQAARPYLIPFAFQTAVLPTNAGHVSHRFVAAAGALLTPPTGSLLRTSATSLSSSSSSTKPNGSRTSRLPNVRRLLPCTGSVQLPDTRLARITTGLALTPHQAVVDGLNVTKEFVDSIPKSRQLIVKADKSS